MENKIYMAIGKAAELAEVGAPRKRYIGYTNVNVVGVNPNKAEWEKLYGIDREDEPVYLSKTEVYGKEVEQLRIDFIVKTDPAKSGGITITDKISYFIYNTPNYKKDGSGIQMVNKYGEFTWMNIEDAKNGVDPNRARFNNVDMRPAFRGERELTGFIRAYAGIVDRTVWNNTTRTWDEIKNPDDAMCRLDNVSEFFAHGNIREIKDIPMLNQVKVLFGIKKTDDGKIYSDIYSKTVLKSNQRDSSWIKVENEIKDAKEAGQYPNTAFEICEFKEYVPEKSIIEKPVWNEAPTPAFGGGVSKFFNKG